ncbi:MAG: lactococcin 972 family bacteriocin [Clostridiaceae bacterium]
MKRKMVTFALGAILAVGAIAPMTAKAYSLWQKGFNNGLMIHYSNYYHSTAYHYSTVTVNNRQYSSLSTPYGYWSEARAPYTGPYTAVYGAYTQ